MTFHERSSRPVLPARLLSKRALAARLGMSERNLRRKLPRLMSDHGFPQPAPFSDPKRWWADQVDTWLAGQRGEASADPGAPQPPDTPALDDLLMQRGRAIARVA